MTALPQKCKPRGDLHSVLIIPRMLPPQWMVCHFPNPFLRGRKMLKLLFRSAKSRGVDYATAIPNFGAVLQMKHFMEQEVLKDKEGDFIVVESAINDNGVPEVLIFPQLGLGDATAPVESGLGKLAMKVAMIEAVECLFEVVMPPDGRMMGRGRVHPR